MDETVWIPMECKDLEGEVLYYHRKLGNQTYAAHVFLVQYDSPEKLKNNWERLNEEIAGCYQGDVDSLLPMKEVPIWEKSNLTLEEAAAYSGVGINKLRSLSDHERCQFVLWIGSKRLIKRRRLDEYLDKAYSI